MPGGHAAVPTLAHGVPHIGVSSGQLVSESTQVVRVTRPPMKGCPLPEAEVSLLP